MDSNRNTVLQVIVLGIAIAAVLVFGFAGCRTGTETKTTQEPDQSQAQPEASEKVARLEKENAALREKVANLKGENDDLRRRLRHAKALVKIAIDQGFSFTGPFPSRPIEAIVQRVDNESKIVMLSVGSADGVSEGMRFHVSRDGSYVGEVRVDSVSSKSCSASFVLLKPGMKIQVGDTAATRI